MQYNNYKNKFIAIKY